MENFSLKWELLTCGHPPSSASLFCRIEGARLQLSFKWKLIIFKDTTVWEELKICLHETYVTGSVVQADIASCSEVLEEGWLYVLVWRPRHQLIDIALVVKSLLLWLVEHLDRETSCGPTVSWRRMSPVGLNWMKGFLNYIFVKQSCCFKRNLNMKRRNRTHINNT